MQPLLKCKSVAEFSAFTKPVCNFQSTKSSVELNSVLLKFFCCHLVWWEVKLGTLQMRPILQILLSLRNNKTKSWIKISAGKLVCRVLHKWGTTFSGALSVAVLLITGLTVVFAFSLSTRKDAAFSDCCFAVGTPPQKILCGEKFRNLSAAFFN